MKYENMQGWPARKVKNKFLNMLYAIISCAKFKRRFTEADCFSDIKKQQFAF